MSKKTKKHPGGRPRTEFSDAIVEELDRYDGLSGTATELQELLGISSTVFYRWLKDEPKFGDAVKRVRARADQKVENAFFKRAIGYDYVETANRTEEGVEGVKVTETIVNKHVVPDAGAALNWLKNRQPDVWRDKQIVEVQGDEFVKQVEALSKKLYPDEEADNA